MSEHFKNNEFKCHCGCGVSNPKIELIERLEMLRTALGNNPIEIVSGVRCPKHSIAVGGYADDMHVLGGAVDIRCRKTDGTYYKAETICEQAEMLGFGGIGIITDNNVHIDIRDSQNIKYANKHWFGDERNGNNNIPTFRGMGETIEKNVSCKTIFVTLTADNKQYSGYLERI